MTTKTDELHTHQWAQTVRWYDWASDGHPVEMQMCEQCGERRRVEIHWQVSAASIVERAKRGGGVVYVDDAFLERTIEEAIAAAVQSGRVAGLQEARELAFNTRQEGGTRWNMACYDIAEKLAEKIERIEQAAQEGGEWK